MTDPHTFKHFVERMLFYIESRLLYEISGKARAGSDSQEDAMLNFLIVPGSSGSLRR